MDERKKIPLTEQDLDLMLRDSLSAPPPQAVVRAVTPWRTAINRVLTGLALTTLTFEFAGLNHILPLLGLVLMLLGFRRLRRENRWFMACWVVTLIRCAFQMPLALLRLTIYQDECLSHLYFFRLGEDLLSWPRSTVLTAWNAALTFALFLCLWQAFRSARKKAGLPPGAGAAAALLVWYGLLCLLALADFEATLMTLLLIAAYALILCSLFRLSRALDEAGYAVTVCPVRWSDRRVAGVLLAVLALGSALCVLFWSRYPMDWAPAVPSQEEHYVQIRDHLSSLGFPEDVLADLSSEELMKCRDAVRVVVQVQDRPSNDAGWEALRVTHIALKLEGAENQWRMIHHFRWLADPTFPGTQAIQLQHDPSKGWRCVGAVGGRVLYDRDGQSYTSSYYYLEGEPDLYADYQKIDVYAAFSLPNAGTNHRGYVSYYMKELDPNGGMIAFFNYTRARTWLQCPLTTAMTHARDDSITSLLRPNAAFERAQYYMTLDGEQLTSAEEPPNP